VVSHARQARVHTEGRWVAAPARDPRDQRQSFTSCCYNALEPEWEARFEPRPYGFRPGRGCHYAIEVIFLVGKGRSPHRQWVLDAALAAVFNLIGHDHLLSMLGTFPARGLIARWLKAGVVEAG
jgi:RNA-directed DNA polymerase